MTTDRPSRRERLYGPRSGPSRARAAASPPTGAHGRRTPARTPQGGRTDDARVSSLEAFAAAAKVCFMLLAVMVLLAIVLAIGGTAVRLGISAAF